MKELQSARLTLGIKVFVLLLKLLAFYQKKDICIGMKCLVILLQQIKACRYYKSILMWPHLAYISAVMLKMDLICTHPSTMFPIHPKDNSSTKNSSPKTPCHSLMFTHTWINSWVSSPFALQFLQSFFLHLSLPFLSVFTFSPVPSSLVFSSHYPLFMFSLHLTFVSVSSPAILRLLLLQFLFLLPPQASSVKLGTAAPLWCSMHFLTVHQVLAQLVLKIHLLINWWRRHGWLDANQEGHLLFWAI